MSELFLSAHRFCPQCQFDLRTDEVKAKETRINIYTDGSCLENPGPGGYCAVILADGTQTEVVGAEAYTTNNRMELQAAIAALEKYRDCKKTRFRIVSDSKYLIETMQNRRISSWEKRGWKTAAGDPVKNQDLWMRLDNLTRPHDIKWVWVKGHDGNQYNELANSRALEEALHTALEAAE
jgi:ribonuclease HI